MKRTLLARLRTNGVSYILSALLLVVLSPLYQLLVLGPRGYNEALSASTHGHFTVYLQWIHTYLPQFLLYRLLLILAVILVLSLPFALFRIIVAQELLAQQEREEEAAVQAMEAESVEDEEGIEDEDYEDEEEGIDEDEQDEVETKENTTDGLPAYPWRGKGFVIIAAWAGMIGLVIYLLGSIASTLYFLLVNVPPPVTIGFWSAFFNITNNTVAIGLLALSGLFFGAMIARSGLRLWPGIWVAFGYTALAVAALFSGSAVSVASAPSAGQGVLTTPAILLFALWVLWLGVMLVRLKPEP